MTTVATPVRFGIVGLGFGGGRLSLIKDNEETELVAVCSRSPDRARAAGEQFDVAWSSDYQDLLARPDIDAIGIYTPSAAHMDLAIAAARAGKHVLVTKPLEITLPRIDAIVAACEREGVKLTTEFAVRYVPANYALFCAVSQGRLGSMILGEFSEKLFRPGWYYESDGGWRGRWQTAGGGTIINQAIHVIDQMLWMFGKADSVTALTGTFMAEIETEDTAAALIRFSGGAICVLTGTTTFRNDKPPGRYGGGTVRRIEVSGMLGSARIDDEVLTTLTAGEGPDVPQHLLPPAANVFVDFARWISDDGYRSPTLVDATQSRASMEVVAAIYRSSREGRSISL